VLFNSYPFIFAFLPLVLAGFFLLRHQGHRLAFVVLASYVFYAWEEWWFPALMLSTTAISFGAGLLVERTRASRQTWVVAGGVTACLALLAFFKYAAFLSGYASSFVAAISKPGLPGLESLTENILLPAGISFYTFEAISYLVDIRRGVIRAERNPLRYAFFISFFPHLIAGPIVRYGKLGPQLERLYRFDVELFRQGVLLFSLGLAKKVIVADGIAFKIDPLLADPSHFGFVDGWMTMVAYAFQIYFDFSAYTDMALGLALMFGLELPWNFDRPYRAASPSEFWRRWHVTLSSWLRDYLYIPLGGNRKGPVRRDANLMATMGLGGLWHGASANFLVWGLWHGLLLVGHRHAQRLPFRPPRFVAVATTFVLVVVGWVFFRLTSTADILDMLGAMAGLNGAGTVLRPLVPYLLLAGVLMWCVPEEWRWSLRSWGPRRTAAVGALAGIVLVLMNTTQKFIYFQF
jgi:alginate O-acetyltransferase complex protein AlgI